MLEQRGQRGELTTVAAAGAEAGSPPEPLNLFPFFLTLLLVSFAACLCDPDGEILSALRSHWLIEQHGLRCHRRLCPLEVPNHALLAGDFCLWHFVISSISVNPGGQKSCRQAAAQARNKQGITTAAFPRYGHRGKPCLTCQSSALKHTWW